MSDLSKCTCGQTPTVLAVNINLLNGDLTILGDCCSKLVTVAEPVGWALMSQADKETFAADTWNAAIAAEPPEESTSELKLCKDCTGFKLTVDEVYIDPQDRTKNRIRERKLVCMSPMSVDLVMGKPLYLFAETMRSDKHCCGPDGKWFIPIGEE